MLVLFQNKLIYLGYLPPGARHQQHDPNEYTSLCIQEQTVETPDHKRLHGFVVESKKHPPSDTAPVLIYFQGNAGNMIHRFELFDTMLAGCPPGTTLVGICYRGFGSSTGRATERGLALDARAILERVHGLYPSRPIYLYGHSLGGAVCVELAASSYAKWIHGVILENTFTGILDMVSAMYPRYTPYPMMARWFLWNHWDTLSRIKRVQQPVLLLSSERDEIVPPVHMARINDAAPCASLVRFPRAMHMDMFQVEPRLYKTALQNFFDTTLQHAQGKQ